MIDLKESIKNIEQLETEAEMFIVILQQAAWNNTPSIKKSPTCTRYPKEIVDLMVEKLKIRKKWQLSRFPEYKNKFNNLSQRITRAIKKIKKFTSPLEVNKEIMNKIESKKSPGYDLITGEILKKLPKKAVK